MMNPELLTALYALGAEVVLAATDVRRGEYSFTFAGQTEPLALTLPAGHYILCRVPDSPGPQPGLYSVTSPVELPRGYRRKAGRVVVDEAEATEIRRVVREQMEAE